MKNKLLVLAEGSSADRDTGQWSIFNTIDRFKIEKPQEESFSLKGKFDLVAFYQREDNRKEEEFVVIYKFVTEKGEDLIETPEVKFNFKEGTSNLKHRIRLSKIPFKGEGTYYFQALVRENGNFKKIAQSEIALIYS